MQMVYVKNVWNNFERKSWNARNLMIQSKCGIVPGIMYDCSKEHILQSVDGILKRLQTDYLDCLLLHRPDALMEPEEVAEAFDELKSAGKVRYFGVSNQKPSQIKLLSRWLNQEIEANQLQFSITNSNMVRNGMEVNMTTEGAIERDGSVWTFAVCMILRSKLGPHFSTDFLKVSLLEIRNLKN